MDSLFPSIEYCCANNTYLLSLLDFHRFWILYHDSNTYSLTAIERHILIFHDRWVSTRKKRIFNHYIPIIALVLYCLLYYMIVIYSFRRVKTHLTTHLSTVALFPVFLSISSLFLIFYVPSMFIVLAQLCNISLDISADFQLMVVFVSYYSIFLLPIVCGGTLPELRNKIKKKFKWMQQPERNFAPQSMKMTRMRDGRKLQ
jgi:hypothetical protein